MGVVRDHLAIFKKVLLVGSYLLSERSDLPIARVCGNARP
jgi:hypothetical protein